MERVSYCCYCITDFAGQKFPAFDPWTFAGLWNNVHWDMSKI